MTRINTKSLFLIHYNLKRVCNNQSVPEGPRFLVQISAKFVNKREQEVGRTEPGTLLLPRTRMDSSAKKWYFVTKIVLTYYEKKLFQGARKTFEIRG